MKQELHLEEQYLQLQNCSQYFPENNEKLSNSSFMNHYKILLQPMYTLTKPYEFDNDTNHIKENVNDIMII